MEPLPENMCKYQSDQALNIKRIQAKAAAGIVGLQALALLAVEGTSHSEQAPWWTERYKGTQLTFPQPCARPSMRAQWSTVAV